MKKLTQQDREKLKENFRQSKFGRNLLKFLYDYKGIWLINFIFAWEFCYYFIIGTLQLTDWSETSNPILGIALWHAYTHHLTDLLCFGIGYTLLAIRLKNFIYAALWTGFIIGITEYSWWLSYIIAHWQLIFITEQWARIYFSNELTLVYAIIIIGYCIIKGFSRQDLAWLITLWMYMIIWMYIGFPITYDFNGPTILKTDIFTNFIEIGHWLWSFILFFILVNYKDIRVKLFR